MKVLGIAANDSDNLMISNIFYELERRGHKLKIYSRLRDKKSLRMFQRLNADICDINELDNETISEADCIFSALRAHIDLNALKENVFCNKYIYVFNNYIDNTWYTPGADFMFTCGTSRQLAHMEDCANMPLGLPKNDYMLDEKTNNDSKEFLFIDSGHYPFSHKGKVQVADMLLQICKTYPEYKLVIKPRFLPNDINLLHPNFEHIYMLLEQRSEGKLPENLILLQEHREMQELIDHCSCAIMLCTSAYLDVALRNKNMVIVRGIDNEDKYELRNDIEYKNIYGLREKSGCVVNYDEIMNYLPEGLHCNEEHLKEVVTYKTRASERAVEVMEFIHKNFISKGRFPAIQQYNYETYQDEMREDAGLSWDVIKHKRIKNIGNNYLNYTNRIIADIDNSPLFEYIDTRYVDYPASLEGVQKFLSDLQGVHQTLLYQNREKLMKDPLDQAELLRSLFDGQRYSAIFSISPQEVLCTGPYHYYLAKVFYIEKEYVKSLEHFHQYFKESAVRAFAKYDCEYSIGMLEGYRCIANMYNGENISPEKFAEIYEIQFLKHIENQIPYRERKRLYQFALTVSKKLYEQGQYELASQCALRCMEQINVFNEDRRRVRLLQQDNTRMLKSASYRIGRGVTFLPRKTRAAFRFVHKNGMLNTHRYIWQKIKEQVRQSTLYKINAVFKKDIWKGYQQYALLQKEFGRNSYLYLTAGGTGDVYISNLFYNSYIELKRKKDVAVCVCPGDSCFHTTSLFHIDRKVNIRREDWTLLLCLFRFMGSGVNLEMLYYHIFTVYTGCLTWLESFKGWNLYRLMNEVCLAGLSDHYIERPEFNYDTDLINRLFSDNGLKKGRTVILSPYAKWPPSIIGGFWEKLAGRLIQEGFSVCTNSIGEAEPPIDGTIPIFFPYELSVPFIEAAGYIVGLRSGFLDIIESAAARKVALYPYNCAKRGIADGTAMGSFSLNEMFGRNDWLELETTLSNLNDVIDNIIRHFISEREERIL